MEIGTATVKALYLYPIKACKGISVDAAVVSSSGFRWDRQWMVVNSKGRMLTQRVEPRLALVEVSLPEEALTGQWGSLSPDSALSLRAPGMEVLQIPLAPTENRRRVENVSVWEWAGAALDEGPDAAEWFTGYLGKPSQLVRFDTAVIIMKAFLKNMMQSAFWIGSDVAGNLTRPTDAKYASGFETAFTDGFPFLLISQASLDALNKQLPTPLPINRFRPNIFVQGCEAFAEDFWHTFTISGLIFHGVKLCSRCKVTTVNQETGQVGPEPLKTLQSFRAGRVLSFPRNKGQVYFGQNIVCEQSMALLTGEQPVIRVGDELSVLNRITSISENMI